MNIRKPVDYSELYHKLDDIIAENLPQMREFSRNYEETLKLLGLEMQDGWR